MQTIPVGPNTMLRGSITVTDFDRRRLSGLIEAQRRRSLGSDRLDELELELERADTVDAWSIPADIVTMNSTVEVADLVTGNRLALTVVFPAAADADAGRISILAPAGLALLGAREGAQVEWPTASGAQRVLVERVSFQPEASGKFNL